MLKTDGDRRIVGWWALNFGPVTMYTIRESVRQGGKGRVCLGSTDCEWQRGKTMLFVMRYSYHYEQVRIQLLAKWFTCVVHVGTT